MPLISSLRCNPGIFPSIFTWRIHEKYSDECQINRKGALTLTSATAGETRYIKIEGFILLSYTKFGYIPFFFHPWIEQSSRIAFDPSGCFVIRRREFTRPDETDDPATLTLMD